MFLVPNFLRLHLPGKLPSHATWTASLMEEEVPHGGPALGLASSQSEPVAALEAPLITHPRHSAQLAPAWAQARLQLLHNRKRGAVFKPSWPTEPRLQVPWSRSHGRALASALAVGVAVFSCSLEWVCRVRGCFGFVHCHVFGSHDQKAGRGCLLWSQGSPAEFSHSGCKRNGRGVSHCMRREQEDILLMPKPFSVQLWGYTPQKKGKISVRRASPPAQWGLAPGSGPVKEGPGHSLV